MCQASPGTKRRAGVLCFRDAADSVEFLLVTRRSKTCSAQLSETCVDDKYTIPAGKFEDDSDISCEDCALREALEEAGIECSIVKDIGWHKSVSKHNQPIQTRYFLSRCIRMLDSWLEEGMRERMWLSPTEALQKVGYREDLLAVVHNGINALRERVPLSPHSFPAATFEEAPALRPNDREEEEWQVSSDNGATDVSSSDIGEERFIFYSHQVGGHFCMVKPAPGTRLEVELPVSSQRRLSQSRPASAENCIVHGAKVILKPFNVDEERFYCQLSDGPLSALSPFTPLFYGTKQLRRDQIESLAGAGPDKFNSRTPGQSMDQAPDRDMGAQCGALHIRRYLVLEDLASNALKPCFLDLKVGCKQRAARHSAQKRAHMAAKAQQSTSATLGFRICGMQCHNSETGTAQRYDKYWGQRVTVETMRATLAMFFSLGPDLIEQVIEKLQRLEATVRQLVGLRFWGSSLLVFFDAARANSPNRAEFLASLRLKIIDFANFQNVGGSEPDEEYLVGIANIRIYLQELLAGDVGLDPPLESRLLAPPSPEAQDAEQEQAWQDLQRLKGSTLRTSEGTDGTFDEGGGTHFAANAQTISGATGRTLLRELASNHLVRVQESEAEGSAASNLDSLFS